MRNVFSLCFSIFVFLSCFPGKPVFFFCGQKKSAVSLYFRSKFYYFLSLRNTDSHRFFLYAGSQGAPPQIHLHLPCSHTVCVVRTFFAKCLQVQSLITCKDRKAEDSRACTSAYFYMLFVIKIFAVYKNICPHQYGQMYTLSICISSVGITQIRCGRRSIFLSACHTSSHSLILTYHSTALRKCQTPSGAFSFLLFQPAECDHTDDHRQQRTGRRSQSHRKQRIREDL